LEMYYPCFNFRLRSFPYCLILLP